MKAMTKVAAAGCSAAMLTALLLLAPWDRLPAPPEVEVDPIVSASIPPARTDHAAQSYTVTNLDARTVCLVQRGEKETGRSRLFRAAIGCDEVWAGLSAARTWTENGDGSVTLADEAGSEILVIAPRDTFDYTVIEPMRASLAWVRAD